MRSFLVAQPDMFWRTPRYPFYLQLDPRSKRNPNSKSMRNGCSTRWNSQLVRADCARTDINLMRRVENNNHMR